MSKARNLSDFISDATIDSTEIADLSVTHAKLHTDVNLSSKTLTFAANQISGNSVDGGVISNFASTGIDDNASATAVTILSDGKVGIGTTSPAQKLHVYSTSGNTYAKLESNGNNTRSALLPSAKKSDGSALNGFIGVVGDANKMEVATTTNDPIHFYTNNSPTNNGIFLKADGNVGIGATNPTAKLQVEGTFSVRTSSNQSFNDSSNANNLTMTDSKAHFNLDGADKDFQISSDTVTHALFVQGSDGRVGIGSDNPGAKLKVDGPSGIVQLSGGSTGSSVIYGNAVSNHTGELIQLIDKNGAQQLVMTNAGKLGIGTSSAVEKLHVSGGNFRIDTDTNSTLNIKDAGTNAVAIYAASSDELYIGANDGYRLRFKTDGHVVMDNGGSLGINTSSPNEKLDVNGRLRVAPATPFANLNQLGYQAAIYAGETSTGTGASRYIPLIAHTSTSSSGYRQHTVFGSRRGGVWGSAFIGVGGNDAYPTVAFEFDYGGTFTAPSTKNFRIDHPIPEKTNTHYLVHAAIEGPQADLIYRGKINLVNGSAAVDLDQAARMTSGTFILLCTNVQCFTTNESNWDLIKGSVSGSTLTIESQNANSTAEISWMVVAERKDNGVQHFPEGRLEVEPLKENEPE